VRGNFWWLIPSTKPARHASISFTLARNSAARGSKSPICNRRTKTEPPGELPSCVRITEKHYAPWVRASKPIRKLPMKMVMIAATLRVLFPFPTDWYHGW